MQGAGDHSEKAPGRLLAVGDVHGCIDELSVVLDAIQPTPIDKVVFLGDYVDRGPNSRAVVDLLIALRDSRRCQTVFLRGNHEDMFLDFLGERGGHGDAFLFNGGRTTLASYGLPPTLRRSEARAQLPESHLQFLRELEFRHEDKPFLFVHAAGFWIRTKRICSGFATSSSAIVILFRGRSSSDIRRSARYCGIFRSRSVSTLAACTGTSSLVSISPRECSCK
jgi:Calcineurin-like phosphoesterase